jgi:hypothetical protein
MGDLSNYGENIIGSEILKISSKIKSKLKSLEQKA